jgi:hypothetical protein
MNTVGLTKRHVVIKLILIAIAFLLFIITAGRHASADDTSAIYAYTGEKSVQQKAISDGIEFNTQLIVNGEYGPYPLRNFATQKSDAIVDMDKVTSLAQEVTIKNTTDKDYTISSYQVSLPRWINPGSQVVAARPFSEETQNGLTTRWFSYVNDQNDDPTKLRSFNITGKLPAGQEYKMEIPLKINDPKAVKVGDTFNIDNTMHNSGISIYSYFRFGKAITDSNGNSTLSSTGRYIATTRDKNRYLMLPNKIQQLMPKMNDASDPAAKNELRINDFPSGSNEADFNSARDTKLYTGGLYFVQLDRIKNAVRDEGYSVAVNSGTKKLYDFYSYNTSVGSPITDPNTGKPVDVSGKDGYGTVYVELRQVIDAHDSTINSGSTWKAADNGKIVDHSGKPVDLTSAADVKVTGSVNTAVPGKYKITYTYLPDNVSKTITVTVTGGSGSGGSGNNNANDGSTNGSGTNGNNSNNSGSNSNNSSGNQPNVDSNANGDNSSKPVPSDGPQVAVKGEAVYATKKIGLYKKTVFNKNSRIKWYSKAKRVNRPQFIVKGYLRDNTGKLRYRVQQYNPYTRKYVKGTKGYITASAKYVVRVYYQSVPKSKKVTIINRKGVNVYKKLALTQKVKHYKKGAILKVKKVVKHKYSTRYVLNNDQYVTANKKFMIAKN